MKKNKMIKTEKHKHQALDLSGEQSIGRKLRAKLHHMISDSLQVMMQMQGEFSFKRKEKRPV
jgi:hypothetical protein